MIDKESELYARLRTEPVPNAPPDAPTPDLFIACGHEPAQSAMQLHGVCIFCYRNRLGEVSRQRNALQASIDAAGDGLPEYSEIITCRCGDEDEPHINAYEYNALREAAARAIAKERQRAEAAEAKHNKFMVAGGKAIQFNKQRADAAEEKAESAEAALADARHQQHVTAVFAEKQKAEYEAEIARLKDVLGNCKDYLIFHNSAAADVLRAAIDAARKETK